MIVGVNVAKHVFQLYWVDWETGEEINLRLTRAKFLRHFANHVPCLVALEACGGSQHWARHLQEIGQFGFCRRRWCVPLCGGSTARRTYRGGED